MVQLWCLDFFYFLKWRLRQCVLHLGQSWVCQYILSRHFACNQISWLANLWLLACLHTCSTWLIKFLRLYSDVSCLITITSCSTRLMHSMISHQHAPCSLAWWGHRPMYVFGPHDSCTVVAYMNPGTHDATISAAVPLLALYAKSHPLLAWKEQLQQHFTRSARLTTSCPRWEETQCHLHTLRIALHRTDIVVKEVPFEKWASCTTQ